ncbi:hypothetical protein B0T16DRAFT_74699 [Cercophora newfieldiana]|uniref:Uncharacterized protein n=1 Tax=Cercophora newfieldiana TaxID=92897 RepID=A0AA39YGT0_9PEZI|nr:hypothetical protein B0T16DRAFT_74699 [Cercophora newfieldiana]
MVSSMPAVVDLTVSDSDDEEPAAFNTSQRQKPAPVETTGDTIHVCTGAPSAPPDIPQPGSGELRPKAVNPLRRSGCRVVQRAPSRSRLALAFLDHPTPTHVRSEMGGSRREAPSPAPQGAKLKPMLNQTKPRSMSWSSQSTFSQQTQRLERLSRQSECPQYDRLAQPPRKSTSTSQHLSMPLRRKPAIVSEGPSRAPAEPPKVREREKEDTLPKPSVLSSLRARFQRRVKGPEDEDKR